jgi:ribosomal protein S18 acetylase RimI-like enzyme
MDVEFRSAAQFPPEEIVATATRGFEGYLVPVRLDVATLLGMTRVDSVDLGASVVALRGTTPVGVALVARRGGGSRLAGMSIEPQSRRQGIGLQLVRHLVLAARERGEREFVLECIEQNVPALRLYHAAGFKDLRRLVGYVSDHLEPEPDAALEEVDPASVSVAVSRWGLENLPWQIAPETLAALNPPHCAFRLGAASAIITDPADKAVTLRGLVVKSEARRQGFGTRLLQALAGRFPEKTWRFAAVVPEEVPEAFFTRLGFHKSALTQFQMVHG